MRKRKRIPEVEVYDLFKEVSNFLPVLSGQNPPEKVTVVDHVSSPLGMVNYGQLWSNNSNMVSYG
jgi:hypothetical protein